MFDSKLFEISEKASNRIDKEKIEKRNQKQEKDVLRVIKMHRGAIDDNGMLVLNGNTKTGEYQILNSIITSHRQKYFEEEYSLYYVDKKYVPYNNGFGNYDVITFIWNSLEYNNKNLGNSEAKEIIKKLNKAGHTR